MFKNINNIKRYIRKRSIFPFKEYKLSERRDFTKMNQIKLWANDLKVKYLKNTPTILTKALFNPRKKFYFKFNKIKYNKKAKELFSQESKVQHQNLIEDHKTESKSLLSDKKKELNKIAFYEWSRFKKAYFVKNEKKRLIENERLNWKNYTPLIEDFSENEELYKIKNESDLSIDRKDNKNVFNKIHQKSDYLIYTENWNYLKNYKINDQITNNSENLKLLQNFMDNENQMFLPNNSNNIIDSSNDTEIIENNNLEKENNTDMAVYTKQFKIPANIINDLKNNLTKVEQVRVYEDSLMDKYHNSTMVSFEKLNHNQKIEAIKYKYKNHKDIFKLIKYIDSLKIKEDLKIYYKYIYQKYGEFYNNKHSLYNDQYNVENIEIFLINNDNYKTILHYSLDEIRNYKFEKIEEYQELRKFLDTFTNFHHKEKGLVMGKSFNRIMEQIIYKIEDESFKNLGLLSSDEKFKYFNNILNFYIKFKVEIPENFMNFTIDTLNKNIVNFYENKYNYPKIWKFLNIVYYYNAENKSKLYEINNNMLDLINNDKDFIFQLNMSKNFYEILLNLNEKYDINIKNKIKLFLENNLNKIYTNLDWMNSNSISLLMNLSLNLKFYMKEFLIKTRKTNIINLQLSKKVNFVDLLTIGYSTLIFEINEKNKYLLKNISRENCMEHNHIFIISKYFNFTFELNKKLHIYIYDFIKPKTDFLNKKELISFINYLSRVNIDEKYELINDIILRFQKNNYINFKEEISIYSNLFFNSKNGFFSKEQIDKFLLKCDDYIIFNQNIDNLFILNLLEFLYFHKYEIKNVSDIIMNYISIYLKSIKNLDNLIDSLNLCWIKVLNLDINITKLEIIANEKDSLFENLIKYYLGFLIDNSNLNLSKFNDANFLELMLKYETESVGLNNINNLLLRLKKILKDKYEVNSIYSNFLLDLGKDKNIFLNILIKIDDTKIALIINNGENIDILNKLKESILIKNNIKCLNINIEQLSQTKELINKIIN